jgi:hypothetical protein
MKTYFLKEKTGEFEYEIQVEVDPCTKTYSLFRSNAECWTESAKGEHLLTITDDGNGMSIKKRIPKECDYAQFSELCMLTQFIKNLDTTLCDEYQVYEETPLFTV